MYRLGDTGQVTLPIAMTLVDVVNSQLKGLKEGHSLVDRHDMDRDG
jgi:hypothetical protein